ncbi:tetratricopeptide repeat protein [Chryseolinea soli]|uniref:histidine kinase n=1 Tax=Chryseolinea soli TaxID=2321403 RepID=A0A385SG80_9BACT|nr:tetratricopeptide repeat protein [Chryseolinea soli]
MIANEGTAMRRAFLFILLISAGANAQKGHTTKWLRELKEAKPDTAKVNLYYALSRAHWGGNLDSVLLMATKGIELADSIGFKKGKALNCLSMGAGLSGQGNYPGAIKYYLEALKLSEELNLEGLSGNVYGNIAIAYVQHGNLKKAIEYFNKALRIAEKYGEAATREPLINLSDLHTKTGEYALARKYATRALAISRAQGDSSNSAIALFNLSEIYRATNHSDSARLYLQESARISMLIHDHHGVSYCLNSMAEMMVNEGKFKEAIVLAHQSLSNLELITNQELSMKAYHILYQGYFGLGNFRKALHYRDQEIALRNSIFNIEKEREANNLLNQYNLERKELQIQLLEKDNRLQQKEIARGSLIKTIYGVGIIALAVLAGFLIFSNIRWKNYNRIVRERNALIQDQKRTIMAQKKHLEWLNNVKDRIISTISHDFRSPLTTLHGFLQLLKLNAIDEADKARAVQQMEQSVSATLMMIENLLTWGRDQMSGLALTPINFDVSQLVDEGIQLVALRAENKKITIVNQIAAFAWVIADRDAINIVLRNLVTNAIKFSKPNDSIYIAMHKEAQRVIISVKDTGIGMSPEQQKSLFSGSANASTAGTENEKGTGLGLALCQELIQQHGGEIWVESVLGSGSTFFFSIPIR